MMGFDDILKIVGPTAVIIAAALSCIPAALIGILSIRTQIKTSDDKLTNDNSIKMIEKMFSPSFRDARRLLGARLEFVQPTSLVSFLADGEQGTREAFSEVLGYFEMLHGMHMANRINEKMIICSFGQRTAYWYVNIIERFENDTKSEWNFAINKLKAIEPLCDKAAIVQWRAEKKAAIENKSKRS